MLIMDLEELFQESLLHHNKMFTYVSNQNGNKNAKYSYVDNNNWRLKHLGFLSVILKCMICKHRKY